MDDGLAGDEVGADRVQRPRELLDLELAEHPLQHALGPPRPGEGDPRHRPVVERRALDELRLADGPDLVGVEAERRRPRDERAHAAAAEPVDGETCLGERGDHADVREAAGAAARENEAEQTSPRDAERYPADADVVRRLVDDVMRGGGDRIDPLGRATAGHRREENEIGDALVRSHRRSGIDDEEQPDPVAAHESVPWRIGPLIVAHEQYVPHRRSARVRAAGQSS